MAFKKGSSDFNRLARRMGGNQAMNATADAIAAIVNITEITKAGQILSDDDLQRAVTKYETKMLPRAFGWVKTNGRIGGDVCLLPLEIRNGTNSETSRSEPDSFKGRIRLFAVVMLLDLAYIYSLLKWAVGFRPVDDAPELPN
jgi:hypothetical protein